MNYFVKFHFKNFKLNNVLSSVTTKSRLVSAPNVLNVYFSTEFFGSPIFALLCISLFSFYTVFVCSYLLECPLLHLFQTPLHHIRLLDHSFATIVIILFLI
jgi:hypothetical protein